VGWRWSVVVCAFGFGVGELGLVGRSLCLQVWNGWVGVGQWWFVLWGWWVVVGRSWFVREGLGLVGWGWPAYLEGNMGAAWGYVGPSWGYVGPSWGICWPILGLCWPLAHLGGYVGPS